MLREGLQSPSALMDDAEWNDICRKGIASSSRKEAMNRTVHRRNTSRTSIFYITSFKIGKITTKPESDFQGPSIALPVLRECRSNHSRFSSC